MCGVPLIGIHSEASTCKCFAAGRASADTAIHPGRVGSGAALLERGSSSRADSGASADKLCQLFAPHPRVQEVLKTLFSSGEPLEIYGHSMACGNVQRWFVGLVME